MKNSIRNSCRVLAVLMSLILMLSGCGAKETTKSQQQDQQSNQTAAAQTQSTEKTKLAPVKLSWYFPWTQQADQDKVWDEVNKYTQEKINTTIDFRPVDWGVWNDKMSVVMASGDDWDIVFSCNWQKGANYQTSVAKGAFLALDELLAKHAPTLSAYPKKYWDCTRIDGKIYGVINMQTMTSQWGIYFNNNIIEKAKVQDAVDKLKKVEDLDPIFEAVKQADPSLYIAGDLSQLDGAKYFQDGYIEILRGQKIFVKKSDPNLKAVNIYEEPLTMEYQKLKSSWYQKEYIKKDQITLQSWDPLRSAGKVFNFAGTVNPGGDVQASNRYGQPMVVKALGNAIVNPNGPISTMESVNAKCKYPDSAVILFELINSDKKLFNLIAFGMEGQHYTKIDDITIEIPKESKYNPGCAWEFGNQFNAFVIKGQPADVWEQTKKLNDEAEENPLTGFNFNAESVKTEIANIDGVLAKYDQMIINGAGDPEKLLKDCNDGMKKAGMDKLLAEVQKQLDAFMATKNK